MAMDTNTALGLLKVRLNRPKEDTLLDDVLMARLEAVEAQFARTGIRLRPESAEDMMLLVDMAAWQYQNRDKPGAMPEWLRLARRERWLAEVRGQV